MKTRMLWLCVGLLALGTATAQQSGKREMWMWKDANGVVHYSDRPAPGATKIHVAATAPAAAAPTPAASSPTPVTPSPDLPQAANGQQDGTPGSYKSLTIEQPSNGATYFGADAQVSISVRSEPALAGTDRLVVFLDGKPLEESATSPGTALSGLDRGMHSVYAVILDKSGLEKIRSETIAFNIRIPTADNPRSVGPTLKPKPQPR